MAYPGTQQNCAQKKLNCNWTDLIDPTVPIYYSYAKSQPYNVQNGGVMNLKNSKIDSLVLIL